MISRSRRWSRFCSLLALAGGWALSFPVAASEVSSSSHILRSDKLVVEVMDPNHPDRYNRGSRFSPVANILQVTMNGRTFLFCPKHHDPILENAGLAGEFDPAREPGPPGFREASEGEGFLKVGVGVLRKSGEIYDFFKTYDIAARAETEARWKVDSASFRQVCSGVQGLAYELSADIQVRNATVHLRWRLTNTGTKPFSTEHYLHNFFSWPGAAVGPDHRLEFPAEIRSSLIEGSQPETIVVEGRAVRFERAVRSHVNLHVSEAQDAGKNGLDSLRTMHAPSGTEIHVTSSHPVSRVFVHATPRYLCPEQFVRLSLAPGETVEWQRTYEFLAP